jgi:hypothetical protein
LPDSIDVEYGDSIAAEDVDATPIVEGYRLDGWYTNKNYTDGTKFVFGTTKVIAADSITLYAKWVAEPNAVTVNFNGNGLGVLAETLPASRSTTYGTKITPPNRTPIWAGYEFAGWYASAELATEHSDGAKTDFSSWRAAPESGDTVMFYAGWIDKSDTINISFDANAP